MYLRNLQLQNIRRHKSFTLDFSPEVTAIRGENAVGKTTIAESIHFLSTGESFRATTIDEVVNFDAELGRIQATIEEDEEKNELEVIVTRGLVQGKRTAKRLFSVNGVRRRKKDLVGKLLSVIFRPEDMRLVEGSPSRRRGFIDTPLSIVFPQYGQSLATYEQTLVRRNKLLQQVKDGEQPRSVLHYWNLSLVKHGEYVQQERQKFFSFFQLVAFPIQFSVEYKPSLLTQERQDEYLEREIIVGRSLIGPHKDDFEIDLHQWRTETESSLTKPLSIATYGSRGQQRLAVLWLKVCELHFLELMKKEKPILVLDDILSELDEESKTVVSGLIQNYQSIVTTTQDIDISLLKEIVKDKDLQIKTLASF